MPPLVISDALGISIGHLDAQFEVGSIQTHIFFGRLRTMALDSSIVGEILIYYLLVSIVIELGFSHPSVTLCLTISVTILIV